MSTELTIGLGVLLEDSDVWKLFDGLGIDEDSHMLDEVWDFLLEQEALDPDGHLVGGLASDGHEKYSGGAIGWLGLRSSTRSFQDLDDVPAGVLQVVSFNERMARSGWGSTEWQEYGSLVRVVNWLALHEVRTGAAQFFIVVEKN